MLNIYAFSYTKLIGIFVFIPSTKSLRTSSNLFVANLAILDMIMMAQLPIFVANSLYQGQVMGKIGCTLFGTLGALAGMGAAVNNVAIAYDRYRQAVTHILYWLYWKMTLKFNITIISVMNDNILNNNCNFNFKLNSLFRFTTCNVD